MRESELEPGAEFSATLTRPDERTVVIHAAGELDLLSATELEAVLDTVAGERTDLVLDLSRLDFIDSTGVHLVVRTVQAYRAARRDIVLRGGQPEVLRAFELVGLLDRLPFGDEGRSTS